MRLIPIILLSFALSACATLSRLNDFDTEAEYLAALDAELATLPLSDADSADLRADLAPLWGEYAAAVADLPDLREALREALRARIRAELLK